MGFQGTVLAIFTAAVIVGGACESEPSSTPGLTATEIPADVYAETCIRPPLPAKVRPDTPPWDPGDKYAAIVAERLQLYRDRRVDYRKGLKDYDSTDDYLNYGLLNNYEDDPQFQWDERGIPLVPYGGVHYAQPTTTAQFALTLHGRVVRGQAEEDQFLAAADALIGLQDDRGAFPYPFTYEYYRTGEKLNPGWVSALAQGQALSVFRRAYEMSGEEKYLAAGNAALDFMALSSENGGTRATLSRLDPSLDRFIFFKEYPTKEPQYTLNGFLFVLLGLYDWAGASNTSHSQLAGKLFECGVASAIYLLPYHDVGGISTYDLGHLVEGGEPNIQVTYHAIHIQLLHALNSVSPQAELVRWRDTWMAEVDPQPAPE